MTNLPYNAPSAYPAYAAGAPAPLTHTQSFPAQAAPQLAPPGAAGAASPPSQPPVTTDQGQAWQLLSQAANAMAAATQAPSASDAPAPGVVQAQAPAPAAATAHPAHGGGIRMTGPWVAGQIYGVVPAAPLTPVPDNSEKWFAITKGRYLGVTNSAAIADAAVSRVSHALRAGYTSQREALEAFNDALAMNSLNITTFVAVIN
ncbi:hypothetical protein B0H11DRAFT_2227075 [Mycena galericulata]|nr:hypothetical protein B0H11DRAFT_2227075 [Mycena galericulata]